MKKDKAIARFRAGAKKDRLRQDGVDLAPREREQGRI